jgi:hypothetical protein
MLTLPNYQLQKCSVLGSDYPNGTCCTRCAERLLVNTGPILYIILQQHYETSDSFVFFAPYTSLTTKNHFRETTKIMTMWELRTLYDILNDSYTAFYNPSEHLALDAFTTVGRSIFKQCVKKAQMFWHKALQAM